VDAEDLMRAAIDATRRGMARGQGPVGCAIALPGGDIVVEHNRVYELGDGTAHAEIVALRAAWTKVGDRKLVGAVVATTCEPCPMCATALFFAGVDQVWFGASIADLEAAGFDQVPIPAEEIFARSGGRVRIGGGVLAEECRALLVEWAG